MNEDRCDGGLGVVPSLVLAPAALLPGGLR